MYRKTIISFIAILAFAVAAPAWAAVHNVTVSDFQFSPSQLNVQQGDTVIWTNIQGFHNVHELGTPSLFGNTTASAPWTYTFVFNLPYGTYDYDCTVHGFQGHITVEPLAVPEPSAGTALNTFLLAQNFPNPFNPSTTIQFAVPYDANVNLIVFNVLGQEVRQLYSGFATAGSHSLTFNGADMPSGLYFYRLNTPTGSLVRTMQYLK